MATYSHPFMNHPGDIPIAEEHVKDVDEIHKW